jgi:hypothetical protein
MGKKDSMKIFLVVISLVSLILISGCLDSFNPRLFTSSYEYNLQIQTDRPLYNVTFIIPLPVKDGIPVVGNKTLTADDFRQPGISAELTQSPPGLNLTGSVPLQGYQPWFVILKADELVPVNGSSVVYSMEKNNIHYYTQLTNFRVVPNPVGTESLIVPKFNFTWKDPEKEKIDQYIIWYKPYVIPQDTTVFVDYQTLSSANITLALSYSVRNSWIEAYDDWYINDNKEIFSEQFTGIKNGWNNISGLMYSGHYPGVTWDIENYPNVTNPEWQQVLNHPLVNPYIPPYSS